ncbi:DUF4097 family beta strand repeat-containing protein [Lachnospiraceae bacterium LCP25S3_G4]
MKKGWKIFWIVCIIITSIGIFLSIAGVALGATYMDLNVQLPGWMTEAYQDYHEDVAYDEEGNPIFEDHDMSEYKNIKELKCNILAGSLHIIPYEGETIKIESAGDIELKSYVEEDDTLVIRTGRKEFVSNNLKAVTVYIPSKATFEEVSLEVKAGEIKVDNIIANNLEINVGAGTATIEDCTVDDLDVECGMGQAVIRGVYNIEADISCGMGEVDVTTKGKNTDFNYDVKCGAGEIRIGDDIYSGIARNKTIRNGSSKNMDIDCGMGEVSIMFE